MKTLLRVEELAVAVLAFYLFLRLGYAWWWFFLLILAPDLSMAGYLINPRLGALGYNIFHHKAISISLFILGAYLHLPLLEALALITFGHSSLDRALGYGLKYPDSFQHTHLGMIGPTAQERDG